jgi:CBS domain-containing protein
MQVANVLNKKGSRVVVARPSEPIDHIIRRLKLEGIGAVVVCEGDAVRGILSERDIVRGLVEYGAETLRMQASELMTQGVITCRPDDNLRDIMRLMTRHRVRHLPVIEGGRLLGLISIGDVVKHRLEELELEAGVLRDAYIAAH